MALMRMPRYGTMSLNEAVNRAFDEAWNNSGGSRVARLPLDTYVTDDAIVITASLPGVNPDDVEIMLEDDTITIRGEIVSRVDDVRYIFSERFHGAFSRTLKLNVPIDKDAVDAHFENGVLMLTLPKAEEVKPKVIKVQAK